MFERFDDAARRVVTDAQRATRRWDACELKPIHLVLGLLTAADDISAVLAAAGVTQLVVAQILGVPAIRVATTAGHIPLSAGSRKALDRASRDARRHRSPFIGTAHLLLGVLDVEDAHVTAVLARVPVNAASLKAAARRAEGPE